MQKRLPRAASSSNPLPVWTVALGALAIGCRPPLCLAETPASRPLATVLAPFACPKPPPEPPQVDGQIPVVTPVPVPSVPPPPPPPPPPPTASPRPQIRGGARAVQPHPPPSRTHMRPGGTEAAVRPSPRLPDEA